MAKLTARDRKEVLRMERVSNKEDEMTVWNRHTYALMSDGTLLQKRDLKFKPNAFESKPRFHSQGWKRVGKPNKTVGQVCEELTKRGYRIVLRDEAIEQEMLVEMELRSK